MESILSRSLSKENPPINDDIYFHYGVDVPSEGKWYVLASEIEGVDMYSCFRSFDDFPEDIPGHIYIEGKKLAGRICKNVSGGHILPPGRSLTDNELEKIKIKKEKSKKKKDEIENKRIELIRLALEEQVVLQQRIENNTFNTKGKESTKAKTPESAKPSNVKNPPPHRRKNYKKKPPDKNTKPQSKRRKAYPTKTTESTKINLNSNNNMESLAYNTGKNFNLPTPTEVLKMPSWVSDESITDFAQRNLSGGTNALINLGGEFSNFMDSGVDSVKEYISDCLEFGDQVIQKIAVSTVIAGQFSMGMYKALDAGFESFTDYLSDLKLVASGALTVAAFLGVWTFVGPFIVADKFYSAFHKNVVLGYGQDVAKCLFLPLYITANAYFLLTPEPIQKAVSKTRKATFNAGISAGIAGAALIVCANVFPGTFANITGTLFNTRGLGNSVEEFSPITVVDDVPSKGGSNNSTVDNNTIDDLPAQAEAESVQSSPDLKYSNQTTADKFNHWWLLPPAFVGLSVALSVILSDGGDKKRQEYIDERVKRFNKPSEGVGEKKQVSAENIKEPSKNIPSNEENRSHYENELVEKQKREDYLLSIEIGVTKVVKYFSNALQAGQYKNIFPNEFLSVPNKIYDIEAKKQYLRNTYKRLISSYLGSIVCNINDVHVQSSYNLDAKIDRIFEEALAFIEENYVLGPDEYTENRIPLDNIIDKLQEQKLELLTKQFVNHCLDISQAEKSLRLNIDDGILAVEI